MERHAILSDRGRHDDLCTDFQLCVIDLLNRTLLANGVGDKEVRREICRGFSERFGDFVDQGWFRGELAKAYPYLCFASRDSWTDMAAGPPNEIIGPEPTSFLYESFSKNVDWYFDEKGESIAPDIQTGSC